jgi:uncharacterized protein
MSFKILCLDGGGIRGLIAARILQELEEQIQQPLSEYFDLIAGTSTGSILAGGLAYGLTAKQLVEIYQNDGLNIFPYNSYKSPKRLSYILKYKSEVARDSIKNIWKEISQPPYKPSPKRLHELLSVFERAPKFTHEGLISVLKKYFGDTKIQEITKTKLLIFAYDTFYRNTTFFTNSHPEKHRWYDDMELWKICTSSSSAPTFFPPYNFKWNDANGNEWQFPHVDGGVSANNPSLAALIHAMSVEKQKIEDISLVSIGTGRTTEPFDYDDVRSWGLLDWAGQIPGIFMGAQLQITGGLSQQILESVNPHHFLRLQFELNQRLGVRKSPDNPREILPKEMQVNKYTGKKVSESIDDASKKNLDQMLEMTEAFLNSNDYKEVDGKSLSVKESIARFVAANSPVEMQAIS